MIIHLEAPTYQQDVQVIATTFFKLSLLFVNDLGRNESLDEYQNEDKNGWNYGNEWHPYRDRLTLVD